jgi:1,3,6,8-tetrahydroxynaphthalene synthase
MNDMGFRPETKQLPIAQMGCTGGGAAINRAREYCLAFPRHNVLIVCVEFCSLLYQPTDTSTADLLCDALFGDGAAACVVKGTGDRGMRIDSNVSYLIPNSQQYISYDFKPTGFHFVLNKEVRNSMGPMAGAISRFLKGEQIEAPALDYCIFHAGGPRILDDLVRLLKISDDKVMHSRRSLAASGNTASVLVLDVIRRIFEEEGPHLPHGARGLLGGFGPGISAEINLSTWLG